MAIDLFVEDLDSVPEPLRDEYVAGDDGRFVLKGMTDVLQGYVRVDDIEKHERTQGLVSALDKERERAKAAERRARELESQDHGMTEEEKKELETLRTARADAEERRRRAEGEFDKWREDIATKHEQSVKEIVGERDQLKSFVCDSTVSQQIAAACNEFGGRANILEPLVQRSIKASFEDGQVVVSVMDTDGTRLLDDNGKPLTVRGLVERMSADKEYGDLFASKQKAGAGSSSETGSGDQKGDGAAGETPSNLKRSELTKAEKVAFIREHGAPAFHKLPM